VCIVIGQIPYGATGQMLPDQPTVVSTASSSTWWIRADLESLAGYYSVT